jgi:hypothetical protein
LRIHIGCYAGCVYLRWLDAEGIIGGAATVPDVRFPEKISGERLVIGSGQMWTRPGAGVRLPERSEDRRGVHRARYDLIGLFHERRDAAGRILSSMFQQDLSPSGANWGKRCMTRD